MVNRESTGSSCVMADPDGQQGGQGSDSLTSAPQIPDCEKSCWQSKWVGFCGVLSEVKICLHDKQRPDLVS